MLDPYGTFKLLNQCPFNKLGTIDVLGQLKIVK